jgi:hypothetical protein
LQVQKEIWSPHDWNALCWFFNVVNVNNIIDGKNLKSCVAFFCYTSLILFNLWIKERNELYHIIKKWNNKIEKHVDANHYVLLAKIFDKKTNSPLRVVLEREQKKKLMCLILKYQSFLVQKILFKMMLCNINNLCKTLAF